MVRTASERFCFFFSVCPIYKLSWQIILFHSYMILYSRYLNLNLTQRAVCPAGCPRYTYATYPGVGQAGRLRCARTQPTACLY